MPVGPTWTSADLLLIVPLSPEEQSSVNFLQNTFSNQMNLNGGNFVQASMFTNSLIITPPHPLFRQLHAAASPFPKIVIWHYD